MARHAATIPSACADLDRALSRPAPPLPARARRAATKAVEGVRGAILAQIERDGVKATAAAWECSESTLHLWRAPGGWLHAAPAPAQGDG